MKQTVRDLIKEYNPDALLADGFDDAIIGIGNQYGSSPVAIYSKEDCIRILTQQFSKDNSCENPYLDALEYFDYNIGCAYVGENTPIFLERLDSK